MKKWISLFLAMLLCCAPALMQVRGVNGGELDSETEVIPRPGTQNVIGTNGSYYASLDAALSAAQAGGTVKLCKDVSGNVTVQKDLCLDLNGFDIQGKLTVASGYTLSVFDSQTDDYTVNDETGYGRITQVAGRVQGLPESSAAAADGYLMVTEADGVSFHRVNLQLTAMTLRASRVGVYYKSDFAGDEVVAGQVERFGVALSLSGAPTAAAPGIQSRFEGFRAGSNGGEVTSTLLYGIMKTGRTAKTNAAYAAKPVYGRAYILTVDGQYLFGAAVSRSLQEQVEAVDTMWSQLTATQKAEVLSMYQTYAEAMKSWTIPNLKAAG